MHQMNMQLENDAQKGCFDHTDATEAKNKK